jgi:uncharacterized protein YacL
VAHRSGVNEAPPNEASPPAHQRAADPSAGGGRPDVPRPSAPSGFFVEIVRLIIVVAFAVGARWIAQGVPGSDEATIYLGIVLGTAVGYVVGGILARRAIVAVSAVERDFAKVPASELLAGAMGLILGLLIAVLLSVFLFRLPAAAAYPIVGVIALLLAVFGYRLGRAKHEDLFGLFGLKPRASGIRRGEMNVLDTSALIDGRIMEVVRAGFLGGTFLMPRVVLEELQAVADSGEPARRARGQRGLRVLNELQRSPAVDVILVDEDLPGDADAQLVRLARDRGGVVVTTDANLGRVAAALDVPVRSLNELALAMRASVVPGEEVTIRLTRPGREADQGIGFLADGTMVVVEGAGELVGSEVAVQVTNVLMTSSGRMVFARVAAAAG